MKKIVIVVFTLLFIFGINFIFRKTERLTIPVVPDNYKGVNTHLSRGEVDTNYVLKKAQEAGTHWIRDDVFSWINIDGGKNQYHWEIPDKFVAETSGFKILGILGTVPSWYNGRTDKDWRCGDPLSWWYMFDNPNGFGDYVYQTVDRYKKVNAWEIWNEPNLYAFNPPLPNSQKYTNLLKAAYTSAKRANPNVLVVAGALSITQTQQLKINAWCGSYTQSDISAEEFLEQMYQAGAKNYFDILSVHLVDQFSSLERLHQIMLENGDDKPIWVTEIEYTTCKTCLTYPQQSQKLQEALITLKKYDFIKKVFYYMLYDEGAGDEPNLHAGLLESRAKNYREKPSFQIFKDFK